MMKGHGAMAELKFGVVAVALYAVLTLRVVGFAAACDDEVTAGDCRNVTDRADDATTVSSSWNKTRENRDSGEVSEERGKTSRLVGKGRVQGTRLNDRDVVYKMLYDTFSFPESTELDALRASRFHQHNRKATRARKKRSYKELRYRTVSEDGRRTPPPDRQDSARRPAEGLERKPREARPGPDPPWHSVGKDFGLPVQDDRWEKHVSGKARDTLFLKKNLQAQLRKRKQQWREDKHLRYRVHPAATRHHRQ